MRRRIGQVLRLGVSASQLALVKGSRWGSSAELLDQCALDPAAPLEAIAPALHALLDSGDFSGWPVAVVVADDLARLWQVTPPANASRAADLEAAAALRFHSLYGDGPSNWAIAADWDPVRPFIAAALPRALTGMLEQAAVDKKMSIVQLVPHFVAAWNRWQGQVRAGSWFGVLHEGVLTAGVTQGRRVVAVRAFAVPAHADSMWLAGQLNREALLLGVEAPDALTLCGSVPSAWNRQDGPLACTVLGSHDSDRSPAERLALAGAAA
ncbi:hypothetical protein E4L96_18900 [Massilia arenosa]|uniref:Uncharacterized protein n=1 Tax=Zemynaea arenosa TaxID=2561931 RepID=A0A4Y9S1P0_9BURK|nr:hypothetical protein [Massilia arenosa]TFW13956.1 hypothetical protein E4L96_18900 [Massilia arenosa]